MTEAAIGELIKQGLIGIFAGIEAIVIAKLYSDNQKLRDQQYADLKELIKQDYQLRGEQIKTIDNLTKVVEAKP